MLSLLITVVGMGLVFAAIVLFWLLMSALVRLASGREAMEVSEREVDEAALKRRAAGVAVAVALAQQGDEQPKPFPLPPTAIVSAWQVAMRAQQLRRRGSVR